MKLRDAKLKSSCAEVFYKKGVLRNFVPFTGKHLCQRPFLIKLQAWPAILLKKGLWHRCFLVNVTKFLRTPFLQNSSGGCFCKLQINKKNFSHILRHAFCLRFLRIHLFSEYITITSSKEALKVCEHNFFQEILTEGSVT